MRYDRGDSFPFEQNGIPFGSKLKGKLSPRSYHIQCERKWKYSFLRDMVLLFIKYTNNTIVTVVLHNLQYNRVGTMRTFSLSIKCLVECLPCCRLLCSVPRFISLYEY